MAGEIIEVTTFRSSADDNHSDQKQSEEGLLLRDNVYGQPRRRRQTTLTSPSTPCITQPKDFSIRAFPRGMQDLEDRIIRIIGEAETRYREDPVRMLRAVRFAAKLGFTMAEDTEGPISELGPLLTHIAPARLFDEVIKLLMSGHGQQTWQLLSDYDLVEPLFPLTHQVMQNSDDAYYPNFLSLALRNTDRRINAGKPVTPAFLYAALLWPAVREQAQHNLDMGSPEMPAWHKAMAQVLERQVKTIAIPKRFSIPMKEIWELQLRLPKRRAHRAEQVFAHPRFRAAYDFLLLREEAGEQLGGLGQWWTEYQENNPEQRVSMQDNLKNTPKPRKRRRRPPRKRTNDNS
ncbi:polynucleotide adenylyltransferase PcnB [Reinekea blandensis]|nr:polynucleotide adenylyltransferase PcnB [Reinekea blandensis]